MSKTPKLKKVKKPTLKKLLTEAKKIERRYGCSPRQAYFWAVAEADKPCTEDLPPAM
jgi:hypothetical protein